MTETTLADQPNSIFTRLALHRTAVAALLVFGISAAQAAPTVEFTAPADVVYPNADSYFNPVAPIHILDVGSEIAPEGVRIDTIPDTGVSILNPPDVVILNPSGEIGPLAPGNYSLDWTATTPDTPPAGISRTQSLQILPYASFGPVRQVEIGGTYSVTVLLSAPALSGYPVQIPFTVGGTADPADHSARDGVITIPAGESRGSYQFTVGAASSLDTITFEMVEPLDNAVVGTGQQTFKLTNANYPANVEVEAQQNGKVTRIIPRDGGNVTLTARISDDTPSSDMIITWASTTVPTPVDGATGEPQEFVVTNNEASFSFDPSALNAGLHVVTVEVSDGSYTTNPLDGSQSFNGIPSTNKFVIRIIDSAPTYSGNDSDGDGLSDATEQFWDSDNDGVADYLDNIPQPYLLQGSGPITSYFSGSNSGSVSRGDSRVDWQLNQAISVSNVIPYNELASTQPGYKLSVGELAFANDSDPTDQSNNIRVPVDNLQTLINDFPEGILQALPSQVDLSKIYTALENNVFSFEVSGISPEQNKKSAYIVIPLLEPISNSDTGRLRLYVANKNGQWVEFEKDDLSAENHYYTAYRDDKGYCPPPGSSDYKSQFTFGHDCLQLLLEEGSIFDADGIRNGRIQFIGGLFKPGLTDCAECDFSSDQIATNAAPASDLFNIEGVISSNTLSNAPTGTTINLIVPLSMPIPYSGAGPLTYYLVDNSDPDPANWVWRSFVIDSNDTLASAPRDANGFCPTSGDISYVEGLHQGAECLQVTLLDNGSNDLDPSVGVINMTGGIYTQGVLDAQPPTLAPPPDISKTSSAPVELISFDEIVDAAGSGFNVTDAISGTTRILPDGNAGPFPPGLHTINWAVTDLGNNTATASQTIEILPQASFAVDQSSVDNTSFTLRAYLNGPALSGRDVTIPFSISGSTANITPASNTITIAAGQRSASVGVTIGDKNEGDSVTFTMDTGGLVNAVAGAKTTLVLTLRDNTPANNQPPTIALAISQNGRLTRTVIKDSGLVTLSANASDATPTGTLNYSWDNPYPQLQPLAGLSGPVFSFDPELLAEGIYTIGVSVSDGLASSTTDITFSIDTTTPSNVATSEDSDGDALSDAQEGVGDSDNDGIADYLDAIDVAEWLQAWPAKTYAEGLRRSDSFQSDNFNISWSIDSLASNKVAYPLLISTDPGLHLGIGQTAFIAGLSHARIPVDDAVALLGEAYPSEIGSIDGYVLDIEVTQLANAGDSVTLIIPQTAPLPPQDSLDFYLFAQGAWSPFTVDASNSLSSYPLQSSDNGYCPRNGYSDGLTTGHQCLQITLVDGGPNDADGQANGTIRLLGGVFTSLIETPAPEAPPYPTDYDTTEERISQNRNDGGTGGGGGLGWPLLGLLVTAWARRVRGNRTYS